MKIKKKILKNKYIYQLSKINLIFKLLLAQ